MSETKVTKKYNYTMKTGRPTKYYPEIINKINEYFTTVGREQTELPTVEGLADYLAITTETVYQWGKKYTEFADTIKKVAAKQKVQLMNDGMYGGKEVNAAMAIFLLKVNHGMNESPTTLVKVNEMKVEFIDASKTN